MVASVELPVLVRSPEFLHGMSGASVESLGRKNFQASCRFWCVHSSVERTTLPDRP